jgi:hypothetical protein
MSSTVKESILNIINRKPEAINLCIKDVIIDFLFVED